MTPKQDERQPINRWMTYKKVSVVMPHCPVCHEQLSGNGSGVLPYKCSCGEWEFVANMTSEITPVYYKIKIKAL